MSNRIRLRGWSSSWRWPPGRRGSSEARPPYFGLEAKPTSQTECGASPFTWNFPYRPPFGDFGDLRFA